uniref:NAC domain-containing protein n=2 Tax=Oryza brachyantha TaxID=4533 RepID=J3N2M0_ORYBR
MAAPEDGEDKKGKNKHGTPSGFRFKPFDLELVEILDDKLHGRPLDPTHNDIFHEVEILDFHPLQLYETYADDEENGYIYFFSRRKFESCNKKRPLRSAEGGAWRSTGLKGVKSNKSGDSDVGLKQTLVFHQCFPGDKEPVRTNWGMHEFTKIIGPRNEVADHAVYRLYKMRKNGKETPADLAADAAATASMNKRNRTERGQASAAGPSNQAPPPRNSWALPRAPGPSNQAPPRAAGPSNSRAPPGPSRFAPAPSNSGAPPRAPGPSNLAPPRTAGPSNFWAPPGPSRFVPAPSNSRAPPSAQGPSNQAPPRTAGPSNSWVPPGPSRFAPAPSNSRAPLSAQGPSNSRAPPSAPAPRGHFAPTDSRLRLVQQPPIAASQVDEDPKEWEWVRQELEGDSSVAGEPLAEDELDDLMLSDDSALEESSGAQEGCNNAAADAARGDNNDDSAAGRR